MLGFILAASYLLISGGNGDGYDIYVTDNWKVVRTEKFAVFYEEGAGGQFSAISRISLMEGVIAAMKRDFRVMGMDLSWNHDPIMISRLYADNKSMRAQHLEGQPIWAAAFYSITHNHVIFCEDDHMGYSVNFDGEVVKFIPIPAPSHIMTANERIVTSHEASHQIAYNCGIQTRRIKYPLWASEGIATNYELTTRRVGPKTNNYLRKYKLNQVHADGGILRVEDLIVVMSIANESDKKISSRYAEFWGFWKFLYETRPLRLGKYYKQMKSMESSPDERKNVEIFEDTIGDVDDIQHEYESWLNGLLR